MLEIPDNNNDARVPIYSNQEFLGNSLVYPEFKSFIDPCALEAIKF